MSYPQIHLKSGRDFTASRGHPWIFSGAIAKKDSGVIEGELVTVIGSDGQSLGVGYYNDTSIAIKMLSFQESVVDPTFWENKIKAAVEYRMSLGLFQSNETDAFRLIHGEGDGIPGCIVDLYGRSAVIQLQNSGVVKFRGPILAAIQKVLPFTLESIYDKSPEEVWNLSGGEGVSRNLMGTSTGTEILENGMKLSVDWEKGQKTGLFLDQRESRSILRGHSNGRSVLNAFSYTGGFSVAALLGGAQRCVSVDSSTWALEGVQRNVELNGVSAGSEVVQADCMQYLNDISGFDCIVLDPPAFAKHRAAVRTALGGYRRINELALKALPAGGLLFTFSCSQLLPKEDFRLAVVQAAVDAGRRVRIECEFRQAPCHPVDLYHPEGEYLKGYLLYVE